MGDAVLSASSLAVGHGACAVLRGVDLDVRAGEVVAVIGRNGAGKSTLLRTLAGLLPPIEGRVAVSGADLASLPHRERAKRIAWLAQEPSPAPAATALQTVLLGGFARRSRFAFDGPDERAAAASALARADAADLASRRIDRISGGERQRVFLARAIFQGGLALVCDEPTAHLDLPHQAAVFALLRRTAAEGRAVVVSTHDLDLAGTRADRVALLGSGRVLALGRPADVLTAPLLREALGASCDIHPAGGGRVRVLRSIEPEGDPK